MNGKDVLLEMCSQCERRMAEHNQRCPFRSISNDYCEEYEKVKESLDLLDWLIENMMVAEGLIELKIALKIASPSNKIFEGYYHNSIPIINDKFNEKIKLINEIKYGGK